MNEDFSVICRTNFEEYTMEEENFNSYKWKFQQTYNKSAKSEKIHNSTSGFIHQKKKHKLLSICTSLLLS